MKDMLPSEQIKAAIKQHTYGAIYSLVVFIALMFDYYLAARLLMLVSIACSGVVIYKLYRLYTNPMLYLANLEALAGEDAPN